MKVLVIDSHKSTKPTPANNLHWINAKQIADHFDGDLIWSYKGVNDEIKSGYDAIIFVHASMYSFVDYAWLEASPDAQIFYITNEYNLGEPRILWMAAKAGRKYDVIANHPQAASKVVNKYVNSWHITNLNSLCVKLHHIGVKDKDKAIYYGSFRKNRTKYFQKYLGSEDIIVSSHKKNHAKFQDLEIDPEFIPRVNWSKEGLKPYKYSLYIEDEKTHVHYNYLANRFYESLCYGVVPFFDKSCLGTIEKSGYDIGEEYIIDSVDELTAKLKNPPPFRPDWMRMALTEKAQCLSGIGAIIERKCHGNTKAV